MNNLTTFIFNLFSFDDKHPLLFTQFNFWVFLALVMVLFSFFHSKRLLRNTFLFLASLFFYYKTSGLMVLLLVFSTLLGYFLGIGMDKSGRKGVRKGLMALGVVVNLLVLCYFKYAYFFTDVYNTIVQTDNKVINYLAMWANEWGNTDRFDASKIILPVGISFFTFQNISYIVDVYKRRIPHVGNIFDFGFYTSFFPQLVAGPIVRADQFVPQLYKPYFLTRKQFDIAVFWILNGLAKKIILSDYLAVNFVDRIFDNPLLFTPFENFSALFVYSLQVYADFSGYTDIATGVAMLMGFYLPKNFNSPYKSTNPAGFWKRWHMSLSNWLKDYLYIPLGGNRRGTWVSWAILIGIAAVIGLMAKTTWVTVIIIAIIVAIVGCYVFWPKAKREITTNINNMDTMLLGGLWHGASFNFITWGGLNGVGILIYKWWKHRSKGTRTVATFLLFALFVVAWKVWDTAAFRVGGVWTGVIFVGTLIDYLYSLFTRGERSIAWLNRGWSIFLTFVFISFTRLFFRSGSNLDPAEANTVAWNTAKNMVHQIGGHWEWNHVWGVLSGYANIFVIFVIGMVIHWLPERWKRWYRINFAMLPLWAMAAIAVLAVMLLYQFVTADLQPFIYFQF